MSDSTNVDLKIIDFVRECSVLYDKSHSDYRKPDIKEIIWKEIAEHIYKRIDDTALKRVRSRWRCLRDSFIRSLKAQHHSPKRRPYQYHYQLLFLVPYLDKQTETLAQAIIENDPTPATNYSTYFGDEGAPNHGNENIEIKFTPTEIVDSTTTATTTCSTTQLLEIEEINLSQSGTSRQQQQQQQHQQQQQQDSHHQPQQQQQPQLTGAKRKLETVTQILDATDYFFLGISNTVKTLSAERVISVKKFIADYVMDEELADLKENIKKEWD